MHKLAPVNFTGAIFIPKFDRPDVVKLRGTGDATTYKSVVYGGSNEKRRFGSFGNYR